MAEVIKGGMGTSALLLQNSHAHRRVNYIELYDAGRVTVRRKGGRNGGQGPDRIQLLGQLSQT